MIFERSNPFGPSPLDAYNLYWEEIPSQSGVCDGTNSPNGLYYHARAHVPGEFVTFLGYEWSGGGMAWSSPILVKATCILLGVQLAYLETILPGLFFFV